MLAAEVIPVFRDLGHKLVSTDINRRLPQIKEMDVSQKEEVLRSIGEEKPDWVFHLAAETNVDLCQQRPEHAFKVNAEGTENIILACKESGSKLVYVSTAAVFDGRKPEPYVEIDPTAPVNIYGQSKLEGEMAVKAKLKEYLIVRAGWMVGGWELDKKFVYKVIQQLKSGKKNIQAVSDKFGTPTFTKAFAANLPGVVKHAGTGTYHMANKGRCSRYDIAVKIVEFMGMEGQVKVEAVDSSVFPLPAPRPRSEMIENSNLQRLGLNNMPFWEESLKEYIRINKDK